MADLAGKGWRVLGYFLWMLGSGVVMDSSALASGRTVMVVGALMFGIGAWQSWTGRPAGEDRIGGEPDRAYRA